MSILNETTFLFIIGSPRSGTSWLRFMLASHPSVVGSVENTLYAKYLTPLLRAWTQETETIATRWTKGLPFFVSQADFDRCLLSLAELSYRSFLAAKPGATIIVDKAPENTFHIDTIRHFFPAAKFLHIIRDGRDVICSMRNVKRKVGHQTENIREGAALWANSIITAREKLSGESCYIEIRYEDLLNNTAEHLRTLFDFCSVSCTEEQVAQILETSTFERMKSELPAPTGGRGNPGHYHKGKAGTWHEELSPDDLRDFAIVGGKLLAELGYADEQWLSQYLADANKAPESLLLETARSLKTRIRYLCLALLGHTATDFLRRTVRRPKAIR